MVKSNLSPPQTSKDIRNSNAKDIEVPIKTSTIIKDSSKNRQTSKDIEVPIKTSKDIDNPDDSDDGYDHYLSSVLERLNN